MEQVPAKAKEVISFWFGEGVWTGGLGFVDSTHSAKWFGGGVEFDNLIREKFGADVEAVGRGDYDSWFASAHGALAAIILMDQFTRNIYRGSSKMYDMDTKSLALSKELYSSGRWSALLPMQQLFVAMPMMHSETLEDQDLCIQAMTDILTRLEGSSEDTEIVTRRVSASRGYGVKHRDVVAKWGRFPHRNAILGRANTPEEEEAFKAGTMPSF